MTYNDGCFKIWIEDGIMFIEWLKERYTYEEIDQGMKIRSQMAQNKEYPIVSYLNKLKVTARLPEARLTETDGLKNLSAVAVVCDSQVHVVLANLFIKVRHFPMPVRVFSKSKNAINWVNKFKK